MTIEKRTLALLLMPALLAFLLIACIPYGNEAAKSFDLKPYSQYLELQLSEVDAANTNRTCFQLAGIQELPSDLLLTPSGIPVAKSTDTSVVVINSNDQYARIVANAQARLLQRYAGRDTLCAGFTYPDINFSNQALLAIHTRHSAFVRNTQKHLFKDDANTRLILVLDVEDCSRACSTLEVLHYDSMLTRTIPPGYSVEFHVRRRSTRLLERTVLTDLDFA